LHFRHKISNIKIMKQFKKYSEVALPVPIDQTFTYGIPEEFADSLKIGVRVLVPFGVRKLTGYVVHISDISCIQEIKPIADVLDSEPVISAELLRVAQWIAEYYLCPLGEAIKAMLPRGMNIESKINISLKQEVRIIQSALTRINSKNQKAILHALIEENTLSLQELRKRTQISSLSFAISSLEKSGIVNKEIVMLKQVTKPKLEKWLRLSARLLQQNALAASIDELKKKAPRQAACLNIVAEKREIAQSELLKMNGVSTSCIRALLNNNLIVQFDREHVRSYYDEFPPEAPHLIALNHDQKKALAQTSAAITNGFFTTFLLYGVTGSGKTQVYIEALKETLTKNKTAIVLVPEISLTPQTVSRFRANFPGLVAVLHSRMSIGERYDSWRKLKDGSYKIAIGPRSAIFAPLNNVGLIVVDEEHEASYKQTDNVPYYHARDVAVVRGKLNEAVVILGSATPSIESYYNVKIHKYHLLQLPQRIDNIPMPNVRIMTMIQNKRQTLKGDPRIFSSPLRDKIEEKLKRKEQIILLQNRRGYSAYIKCHDCDYIEKCENCDITLTYHKTTHRLRCHYCNYIKRAPEVCPKCNSGDIIFQGIGTQRVESELSKLFPDARVIRMDLDTTAQKKSHDRILRKFGQQKYDVLLGTQMIAKGHDFDRVTLVGVISADTALFLPDFRASERTFQLLTQVAGRAGRKNIQGEVIIQTLSPDNFGIICCQSHDFMKFFNHEITQRHELSYPPFSRLIQVLVKGEDESQVKTVISDFRAALPDQESLYQILGPVPAPISKIQNNYRWHFILKVNKKSDPTGMVVNDILRDAERKILKNIRKKSYKIIINVDPASLL